METHDVDETGASVWNGESNNFFNLMELAFAEEKTTNMRLMMTSMQALSGLKSGNDLEKLYAFYKNISLMRLRNISLLMLLTLMQG